MPLVAVFVRGLAFVVRGINWRGFQRPPPTYECQKKTYEPTSGHGETRDCHLAHTSVSIGGEADVSATVGQKSRLIGDGSLTFPRKKNRKEIPLHSMRPLKTRTSRGRHQSDSVAISHPT
jgi:hypothetical protein